MENNRWTLKKLGYIGVCNSVTLDSGYLFPIIVIHSGINNIPKDGAQELLEKFEQLYQDIRKENQGCHIILFEILPRAQSEFPGAHPKNIKAINETVMTVNSVLQQVPVFDNKLHYVNHKGFYYKDGSISREMLSRDGLHLSFVGTEKLVNSIMKKINSLTRVKNDERESRTESSCATNDPKNLNEKPDTVSCGPYLYSEKMKLFPATNTVKPSSSTCVNNNDKDISKASSVDASKTSKRQQFKRKKTERVKEKSTVIKTPTPPFQEKTKIPSNRFLLLKHYESDEILKDGLGMRKQKNISRKRKQAKTLKMNEKEIFEIEINNLVKWIDSPSSKKSHSVMKQCGGGTESNYLEPPKACEIESRSEGNSNASSDENQNFENSNIYMVREVDLNPLDAYEILDNIKSDKPADDIGFRPKGGSVYLFPVRKDDPKRADWKTDGYTWRQYGTNKIKVNNKGLFLNKTYFKVMNEKVEDDRFKKYVFRLHGDHENQNILLIQYIGDASVYKGQPHGNDKKAKKEYVRTKPSVIKNVKQHEAKNPVALMYSINSEINAPCKETGFSNIRNKRQVKNFQARIRKEQGLGPDALYNLHLLYHHLNGYISDIVTAPNLNVILGSKEIEIEFDRILQMKSDEAVPLFYDTTFNLGDFYVSTLSFQHILFDNPSVIPLRILIHERKFQDCHELLLNSVKKEFLGLKVKIAR